MTTEEFLSPREVCDWLGLAPSTLAELRARGDGPAYTRLSARNIRYTRSDVADWVASRRIDARDLVKH